MGDAGLIALLSGVLVASIVGSAHCAGMCGGLALFAVGCDGKLKRRFDLHVGYHVGRGLSYAAVGVLAGSIGAAVDFAGASVSWQRPAAAAAGALMIVFGLVAIAANLGVTVRRGGGHPRWYTRGIEAAHRGAFALPPVARAWGVGVLTPLLPCGWLYAFALAGAGTGSPLVGGLVMLTFWLGTLPLMGWLGFGLQWLTGPLRERLPAVTAGVVVVFGVLTATGRVSLPAFVPEHVARAQPSSVQSAIDAVNAIDARDLPCCNGPGDAGGGEVHGARDPRTGAPQTEDAL
ncbi:MAG: sulfite exporter TauE/SafE family protein [Planctomycetota bacterium]